MKKIISMFIVAGLAGATAFGAMLNQGTRELSVAANLDRDSIMGEISFGQFVRDGMILGVGAGGGYMDFGHGSEAYEIGGDVFGQYHFDMAGAVIPFVGVSGGIGYAKIKIKDMGSESETGLIGEAQFGVKSFIAENIAIAFYGFFDVSNKEVFTDKDEMKKTDYGLRIGMNSYF